VVQLRFKQKAYADINPETDLTSLENIAHISDRETEDSAQNSVLYILSSLL